MIRSQGIELKPTIGQAGHFARACDMARFSYNKPLTEWQQRTVDKSDNDDCILAKSKTSERLNKPANSRLSALKHEYMTKLLGVVQCEVQLAVTQLSNSCQKFLTAHTRYSQLLREDWYDRYRSLNNQICIKGKFIRIPNLGWVRLTEPLGFNGKIVSVKIFNRGGRWYAIVAAEVDEVVEPSIY